MAFSFGSSQTITIDTDNLTDPSGNRLCISSWLELLQLHNYRITSMYTIFLNNIQSYHTTNDIECGIYTDKRCYCNIKL